MPQLKSVIRKYLHLIFNAKSIILLNALLLALCAMPLPGADAAQVTLGWDSNPEPDLEGYVIYRNVGSPGPPYDDSDTLPEDDLADPLHPKATLTGLQNGKEYYIALTAYNTDGVESSFSNDVCVELVNGVADVCGAGAAPAPAAGTASVSGGSGGGSGSGCFISASSGQSAMFSEFVAGPSPRIRVIAMLVLLLVLTAAIKLKKLIHK